MWNESLTISLFLTDNVLWVSLLALFSSKVTSLHRWLYEVWSWLIIQSGQTNFKLVARPLKSVFFPLMNVLSLLEVWEASKQTWFTSTSRTLYRFRHSFATQYCKQRGESLFLRSSRHRVCRHDCSFSDFCFILNVLCLWLLAQHKQTVTAASPSITFSRDLFQTVTLTGINLAHSRPPASWITIYWLSGNRNSQHWCRIR